MSNVSEKQWLRRFKRVDDCYIYEVYRINRHGFLEFHLTYSPVDDWRPSPIGQFFNSLIADGILIELEPLKPESVDWRRRRWRIPRDHSSNDRWRLADEHSGAMELRIADMKDWERSICSTKDIDKGDLVETWPVDHDDREVSDPRESSPESQAAVAVKEIPWQARRFEGGDDIYRLQNEGGIALQYWHSGKNEWRSTPTSFSATRHTESAPDFTDDRLPQESRPSPPSPEGEGAKSGGGNGGAVAQEPADLGAAITMIFAAVLERDQLRAQLAAVEGELSEANLTIKSIATMLGWVNVPPRESLEANIRANQERLGESEEKCEQRGKEMLAAHHLIDKHRGEPENLTLPMRVESLISEKSAAESARDQALEQLAELPALKRRESELERVAEILQRVHPIGKVKAIGLLECAKAVEQLTADLAEAKKANAGMLEFIGSLGDISAYITRRGWTVTVNDKDVYEKDGAFCHWQTAWRKEAESLLNSSPSPGQSDGQSEVAKLKAYEQELSNASDELTKLFGHGVGLLCVTDGVKRLAANIARLEKIEAAVIEYVGKVECRDSQCSRPKCVLRRRLAELSPPAARSGGSDNELIELGSEGRG